MQGGEHLLGCGQGRRIRRAPSQQPGYCLERDAGGVVQPDRDQAAEQDDADGEHVEGRAIFAERREEGRADADANGIDEQDQPEVARKT